MSPHNPIATADQAELESSSILSEEFNILVGQIARTDILECSPDTPLQEVARQMSQLKVSSALILDHGKAVGIWTERDSLKLNLDDPASLQQPVSALMSSPVKTIHAELSLKELAMRFREDRIRHYLVVDSNDQPYGVVSQTDVVINQGVEHFLRLQTLDTVVSKGLQRLSEQATPTEVLKVMRTAGVDAVLIDYADKELGIITESDLVKHVAKGADGKVRAGSLASRPLVRVANNSSLYLVRNLLVHHGYRHIGVTDPQGEMLGIVSFGDILASMELSYVQALQHALCEREIALSATQHHLRLAEQIIESSREGIIVTDLNLRIVSVNPAFSQQTGYQPDEVMGHKPSFLNSGLHGADFYRNMWKDIQTTGYWQGEIWNKRKNGELYPELLTVTTLTDSQGRPAYYTALFNDITQQKNNEEKIRELAFYDPLTGLPNRWLFEDRLNMAIAQAERSGEKLAILFIDLDFFKRINDSLGHTAGDEVLKTISRRLTVALRPMDTLARQGGDEFVALLPGVSCHNLALLICRRLLLSLEEPVKCMGHELKITCSIGVSIYPCDGRTGEDLLGNADTAMYHAKSSGRDRVEIYTSLMSEQSRERLALENALYRAVRNKEFELHYQPILKTDTGEVQLVEALLRWRSDGENWLPPDKFLPVAEELNLISQITDWVMETACKQQRQWQLEGLSHIGVSINMADRHFHQDNFEDLVQSCIDRTGCDPHKVVFELTERMLFDRQDQTSERILALRNKGFKVVLDDFGTGWSSLTHLRTFPLNGLKVDREFISCLDKPGSPEIAIIESLIMMADKLNLDVVAEGVETREQYHILRQMGCRFVQGYLFSQPLPAEEVTQLLINLSDGM